MASTALVAQRARTGLNLTTSEMKEVAEYMIKSGFFPDTITLSQSLAKIQAGQELGIPPFASLSGFHSVNGKPAASARLMGALIKKSGEYDYDVIENTREQATIEIWRTANPDRRFKVTYTIDDANNAELTTGKNKETWKKYRSDMLFARCVSKAIRQHCPHLLYGGNWYVPEELDAKVDDEGDIVQEAEFEERKAEVLDQLSGAASTADQNSSVPDRVAELVDKIEQSGIESEKMLRYYGVQAFTELSPENLDHALNLVNSKIKAKALTQKA